MHLTSHITHSNGYAPYIAYYRSNGYDQRFRKLKPKPKLNPPNAHRSQIKICENRQTQNVQFRLMPNAFRILKPIQKSSKRVWVFRNTGANAFAKNQMRLAYEDKRDLYCSIDLLNKYNCESDIWLVSSYLLIHRDRYHMWGRKFALFPEHLIPIWALLLFQLIRYACVCSKYIWWLSVHNMFWFKNDCVEDIFTETWDYFFVSEIFENCFVLELLYLFYY